MNSSGTGLTGWINRSPVAFVATLIAVLTFGCCGFFGVIGVIGAVVSGDADESTSAEDRNDDADSADDDEAQAAVAVTETVTTEPEPEPEPEEPETYLVVRVVDGDTVELDDGEKYVSSGWMRRRMGRADQCARRRS